MAGPVLADAVTSKAWALQPAAMAYVGHALLELLERLRAAAAVRG